MKHASDDLEAALRSFVNDPPWLPLSGLVHPGARPPERIVFEEGLSEEELARVERRFRFMFPRDLRAMLSAALPVSEGFPDWRSAEAEALETVLDWPADGICFDIAQNDFWVDGWGDRPLDTDEACTRAREYLADAPALVPIFGHRYIPDRPASAGNPVFSVYQSDIVYYARDLADYLEREFRAPADQTPITGARHISVWSDLLK